MNEFEVKIMMWHAVIDAMMEHIAVPRTPEERDAWERAANRIADENWKKYGRGEI